MRSKKDLSLITQLVLSILIFIGGIVIMIFKSFGLLDMVLYGSIIFFILAFFGVITYFIRRKDGDYEILLFSLICTLTATFMFIFKNDDTAMILGAGLTIFNILVVANRIYKIYTYRNQDNFMWTIKFIATFLIGFLAVLTCVNLYKEISVQTLMLGYYFTCLGVIMSIENLIELYVTQDMFDAFVSKVIDKEYQNLEMVDNMALDKEPETKELDIVIEKKKDRKPKVTVNGKDVDKEINKEVKKVKKDLKPVKKEIKKKAKPVVKAIEKEVKPIKKEVKKVAKTAEKKVNKVKREVKKTVIKEEIKKEIKEVKKKGRPKKSN